MFVVLSREASYGGCNCSCFETDEIFGPFATDAEAEKFGKKKFGIQYRVREVRTTSDTDPSKNTPGL
jgi:hypothetical protein